MYRPRRSAIATLVLVLLGVLFAPAAGASGSLEAEFVQLLNGERSARGLAALTVAGDLAAVARDHSTDMAAGNNLHHNPNLANEVSGWQKLGENVGRGPSAGSIHRAFMNSPAHADNILGGDWTEVGIGVVVSGETVWVTQVFRQPEAATPAPQPEPAPQTSPEPTPASAPATSAPAPAPVATFSDAPAAGQAADAVASDDGGLTRASIALARIEASDGEASVGELLGS